VATRHSGWHLPSHHGFLRAFLRFFLRRFPHIVIPAVLTTYGPGRVGACEGRRKHRPHFPNPVGRLSVNFSLVCLTSHRLGTGYLCTMPCFTKNTSAPRILCHEAILTYNICYTKKVTPFQILALWTTIPCLNAKDRHIVLRIENRMSFLLVPILRLHRLIYIEFSMLGIFNSSCHSLDF